MPLGAQAALAPQGCSASVLPPHHPHPYRCAPWWECAFLSHVGDPLLQSCLRPHHSSKCTRSKPSPHTLLSPCGRGSHAPEGSRALIHHVPTHRIASLPSLPTVALRQNRSLADTPHRAAPLPSAILDRRTLALVDRSCLWPPGRSCARLEETLPTVARLLARQVHDHRPQMGISPGATSSSFVLGVSQMIFTPSSLPAGFLCVHSHTHPLSPLLTSLHASLRS